MAAIATDIGFGRNREIGGDRSNRWRSSRVIREPESCAANTTLGHHIAFRSRLLLDQE
jgi:hypothetical protein